MPGIMQSVQVGLLGRGLCPWRVRFSTGVSSCSGVLWCSKRCSLISKRVFCNKINGMGKNKGERFGVEGERFGVEGERFGVEGERFGVEGERFGVEGERFGVKGERFGVEGFEPSLAVENLKY